MKNMLCEDKYLNAANWLLTFAIGNVIYAVARAKGIDNWVVNLSSFLMGYPLTMLSLVVIEPGTNIVFGVSLKAIGW